MTGVAYMVEKIASVKRGRDMRETWRNAVAYIGIAPGTVENIQRERIKFVDRFENKIRAAFIRLLEDEIKKATHELEMARLCASRVDCDEVRAAEAALGRTIEQAREVIAQG